MGKIVQFPIVRKTPALNWDEIEAIRSERFPKIPKKALRVIRKILEDGGDHYFNIFDPKEGYPPDPIEILLRRSELVWMLDLLDRFGGEMSIGKLSCIIKRKKVRYPLFEFQKITENAVKGLHAVCGSFYEHYLESKQWKIMGKEFPETDLIALVIESKAEAKEHFLGLLDRTTAFNMFERLNEAMSIASFIRLAGIETN